MLYKLIAKKYIWNLNSTSISRMHRGGWCCENNKSSWVVLYNSSRWLNVTIRLRCVCWHLFTTEKRTKKKAHFSQTTPFSRRYVISRKCAHNFPLLSRDVHPYFFHSLFIGFHHIIFRFIAREKNSAKLRTLYEVALMLV